MVCPHERIYQEFRIRCSNPCDSWLSLHDIYKNSSKFNHMCMFIVSVTGHRIQIVRTRDVGKLHENKSFSVCTKSHWSFQGVTQTANLNRTCSYSSIQPDFDHANRSHLLWFWHLQNLFLERKALWSRTALADLIRRGLHCTWWLLQA